MRHRLDRRVRRFGDGGRILLGGDPGGLFRLSTAGARVVDAAVDAAVSPDGGDRSGASVALIDHLVERGVLHPVPESDDSDEGTFGAADVTVVVPVRYNADGVARLLESLAQRPRGDVAEIIVVDDGSVDGERLDGVVAASSSSARVVRRPRSGGPAAARNTGVEQVHTPLVAFIDSDCVVDDGWIDGLLGHFADPAVAMAAPRIAPRPAAHARGDGGRDGLVWGYDRARSPLDMGNDPARLRPGGRVAYVPSAAVVARVEVLRDLGGFDESLRTGEDVDVVWRCIEAGHTVRYEPAATVGHAVRGDLGAFLRQRFGYGRSAAALARRHPGDLAPARLSPWSAAIAALLLVGGPGVPVAAALAGWTTWQLRGRLDGVPTGEVARLGFGGHWAAIRQLLRAALREWWPLLVLAAPVSRRARRTLGAALALVVVEAAADGVSPGSLGLAVLDDVAYGAGVWRGCLAERTIEPLLPATPTS